MSVLSSIKAALYGETRKWTIIHSMDLTRVADGTVVGAILIQQDQYGNIKQVRIPK